MLDLPLLRSPVLFYLFCFFVSEFYCFLNIFVFNRVKMRKRGTHPTRELFFHQALESASLIPSTLWPTHFRHCRLSLFLYLCSRTFPPFNYYPSNARQLACKK